MNWRRGSTTSPIRIVNISVGFDGIIVVEIDLQQLALFGVHRGFEKLLRVHFAQTFEALDLHALLPDLENLRKDLRNRKQRVHDRLFAFAFDQLEDRMVTVGIVLDFEAPSWPVR